MSAHARSEVGATARTQVKLITEVIGAEVILLEAGGACNAFCDRVITAISEEKNTLLRADIARSSAVEMKDLVTAERKGVFSRDGVTALRAVRDSQWLNP